MYQVPVAVGAILFQTDVLTFFSGHISNLLQVIWMVSQQHKLHVSGNFNFLHGEMKAKSIQK